MKLGYRRVSTSEQNLARQDLDHCEKVYEDKASGRSKERQGLALLMEVVREGDEVHVWSIDRLARSLQDLMSIVQELNGKGASVHFISEGMTFSPQRSNPAAELQLHLLGAFAQFERQIIEARRKEGVEKAKAEGRYKPGQPRKRFKLAEAKRMQAEGMSIRAIATALGVDKSKVQRELTGYQKH